MSTFKGFPTDTLHFLNDLSSNNNKPWFDENRARYEQHYLQPAKDFVVALGEHIIALDNELVALPAVNKSIFRINRDVRFAKDKTPYKNHLDLSFYTDGKRSAGGSGFFFRLTAERFILGVGMHMFTPENLKRYRQAVDSAASGKALEEVYSNLSAQGYQFGEARYARIPKGYDNEHPRAELLKLKSLHAMLDCELPNNIHNETFVGSCAEHCAQLVPLHYWLNDYVC